MARKKVSTTVYLTPEQDQTLKLIKEKTAVPMAEIIRQGIDLAIEKHRQLLPGQDAFNFDGGKSS